jgi:hypothetical protein
LGVTIFVSSGSFDGNERIKGDDDLNRAWHGIWFGKELFVNTVHARKVFHALEVDGVSDDIAQAESEFPQNAGDNLDRLSRLVFDASHDYLAGVRVASTLPGKK